MNTENNFLCCCEYIDRTNRTNHILACCCDCQDFDEGMEGLISGRGFPQHNRSNCMLSCADRLRIPWIGGAKRVSPFLAISVILVPLLLLTATNGILWTVFSAISLVGFLTCMRFLIGSSHRNFFQFWTATSFIVLYLIFEILVIPFLEILIEENIALTIVILLGYYCFWKTKNLCPTDHSGRHCAYCQKMVSADSRHSLWLGCCIGDCNVKYYTLGMTAMVAALLYGSNLTLTTVCHPFTWFATILLPDDCSYAYDLFELALSFVSGLYSLGLGTFFSVLLLHQLIELLIQAACKRRRYSKVAFSTVA